MWPKHVDITDQTVNQLGLLCLKTKDYFDDAFELLKHNLREVEDTEYIVRETTKSNLIQRFPGMILKFLNTLIAEPKYRPASKLKQCIEEIVATEPNLSDDPAFKRLSIIVKRFE